MSIYATLWDLRFPKDGVECWPDDDWVTVRAQGVPPHIGTPTSIDGLRGVDHYAEFLPPPIRTDRTGHAKYLRAVVFVVVGTKKGTPRNGQEYVDPLLVLTGREYARITFAELHGRICEALRARGSKSARRARRQRRLEGGPTMQRVRRR